MGHALHHAESSARKFGGSPKDYLPIHCWFDATKAHLPLPGHRALRHHAEGLFEAERIFGIALTNSQGRQIPIRFIGEQHIKEDCRRIPTIADWLRNLPIEPWMVNGVILPDVEVPPDQIDIGHWRQEVASGRTLLGFADWEAQHRQRFETADLRT